MANIVTILIGVFKHHFEIKKVLQELHYWRIEYPLYGADKHQLKMVPTLCQNGTEFELFVLECWVI